MESELIYALSQIDKEILAVEREISSKIIPQKLSSLREEYSVLKTEYETLTSQDEKNSKDLLELTAKNEEMVKETKDMEDKLYSSSNVKSIEILQSSLDRLHNDIQKNESTIYYQLEEQEKNKNSRGKYRKKLNDLSKSYNTIKNEYQGHIDSLRESLSILKDKRNSIISKLDTKIVNEYEAVRKSKGYGMSLLKGEICTGCGMSVPYIIISEVKKHTVLQKCPNCDRFLYVQD